MPEAPGEPRHRAVTGPCHRGASWEGAILGRENNWGFTLVYGFAHLGKSLFWYSSEILFAYFLTEIVGLAAGQMGIVLAIGFLVSAAIDMAVGHGLQARLSAADTAARLQLLGSVLCSATILAVFLGAWVPLAWRFVYAVLAGIAFRLGFAVYDIPQNALMALGTTDPAARLRVASMRIWFSGAATLIVAAAVGPLVAAQDRSGGAGFLLGVVLLFAAVAVGSAWLLAQRLRLQRVPAAGTPSDPGRMFGRLPMAFWLLLAVMVATSALTPAFSKLEPYFASYTLRSAWWGGAVILLAAAGILLGQPLWLQLCRILPRATIMTGAALLQIAALALFALAGAASPPLSAIAALLFGLGNGGVGMTQWAAFSETVAALGPERAGPSYGIFSASGKLGFALGGLLLGALLSAIDLDGAGAGTLPLLMAVIPAAGAVLVIGAAAGLGRVEKRRDRHAAAGGPAGR